MLISFAYLVTLLLIGFSSANPAVSYVTVTPTDSAQFLSLVDSQYSTVLNDIVTLRPDSTANKKQLKLSGENCYVRSQEYTLTEDLKFGFFFERKADGKIGIKWYYDFSSFFSMDIFKVRFSHNHDSFNNILHATLRDGFFYSWFADSWTAITDQSFEISLKVKETEVIYSTNCDGQENCTDIIFPDYEPCEIGGSTTFSGPIATVTLTYTSSSSGNISATTNVGSPESIVTNTGASSTQTGISSIQPEPSASQTDVTKTTDANGTKTESYSSSTIINDMTISTSSSSSITDDVTHSTDFTAIITDNVSHSTDLVTSDTDNFSMITDLQSTWYTSSDYASTDFDYSTESYSTDISAATSDVEYSTQTISYGDSFTEIISYSDGYTEIISYGDGYSTYSTETDSQVTQTPSDFFTTTKSTSSSSHTTLASFYPIELDCPSEVPYMYRVNEDSNLGFYIEKLTDLYYRIDWFFAFEPLMPLDKYEIKFRQNGKQWHNIFSSEWDQGFFYSWISQGWESMQQQTWEFVLQNNLDDNEEVYFSTNCTGKDRCNLLVLPMNQPEECPIVSSSTTTGSVSSFSRGVFTTGATSLADANSKTGSNTLSLDTLTSDDNTIVIPSSKGNQVPITISSESTGASVTSHTTNGPIPTSTVSESISETFAISTSTAIDSETLVQWETVTSCSNGCSHKTSSEYVPASTPVSSQNPETFTSEISVKPNSPQSPEIISSSKLSHYSEIPSSSELQENTTKLISTTCATINTGSGMTIQTTHSIPGTFVTSVSGIASSAYVSASINFSSNGAAALLASGSSFVIAIAGLLLL